MRKELQIIRKELQELAENAALAGRRWRLIEADGGSLVNEIDRLVDEAMEKIGKSEAINGDKK